MERWDVKEVNQWEKMVQFNVPYSEGKGRSWEFELHRGVSASTRRPVTCHYCFSAQLSSTLSLKAVHVKISDTYWSSLLPFCWGWTSWHMYRHAGKISQTQIKKHPLAQSCFTCAPRWTTKHNRFGPLSLVWGVTIKISVWKLWLTLSERIIIIFAVNNMQTICSFVYMFIAATSSLCI